jgi:hypothetical protein
VCAGTRRQRFSDTKPCPGYQRKPLKRKDGAAWPDHCCTYYQEQTWKGAHREYWRDSWQQKLLDLDGIVDRGVDNPAARSGWKLKKVFAKALANGSAHLTDVLESFPAPAFVSPLWLSARLLIQSAGKPGSRFQCSRWRVVIESARCRDVSSPGCWPATIPGRYP